MEDIVGTADDFLGGFIRGGGREKGARERFEKMRLLKREGKAGSK